MLMLPRSHVEECLICFEELIVRERQLEEIRASYERELRVERDRFEIVGNELRRVKTQRDWLIVGGIVAVVAGIVGWVL